MSKEFLLTYLITESGLYTFEWFDTEEEILDRIEEIKDDVSDIEAIEIRCVRHLY